MLQTLSKKHDRELKIFLWDWKRNEEIADDISPDASANQVSSRHINEVGKVKKCVAKSSLIDTVT